MYKNIRIHQAYAFFSNPTVSKGSVDVKEGDEFKSKEFNITPDHKTITVKKYDDKKCTVRLFKTPLFLVKLFKQLKFYKLAFIDEEVEGEKEYPLNQVISILYNDGWDDSSHSFKNIATSEVKIFKTNRP